MHDLGVPLFVGNLYLSKVCMGEISNLFGGNGHSLARRSCGSQGMSPSYACVARARALRGRPVPHWWGDRKDSTINSRDHERIGMSHFLGWVKTCQIQWGEHSFTSNFGVRYQGFDMFWPMEKYPCDPLAISHSYGSHGMMICLVNMVIFQVATWDGSTIETPRTTDWHVLLSYHPCNSGGT